MRIFQVDRTLKETLTYLHPTFPVELCTDDYNQIPERMLNCHWHPELEFGLMLSGELTYYLSGTPITMRQGDCVFVNANTMHMAEQHDDQSDAVMFITAFSPTLLSLGMNNIIYEKYFRPIIGKPMPGFVLTSESKHGEEIAHFLSELNTLPPDTFGYELRVLHLISHIWETASHYILEKSPSLATMTAKSDLQNEERAKSILYYIREHYSEDLTAEKIAKHVHLSRSECFRCFKQFTHKTPTEYINEYRLTHAVRMLTESSASISDISCACGFSSSSYFCKLFKKMYNVTPMQYRNKFR